MTSPKADPQPRPITVILVDDHSVVRQGTREMLNRSPDFSVLGEASSGEALMGLLKLRQPDLLLLDINLPHQNGLQLLETIKPAFPGLKIVLFSAHIDLQYIRKAQILKVEGFLSKTIDERCLQNSLKQAFAGIDLPVLSADIAERLKTANHHKQENPFTAREQEILSQLAQGLSNQAIAKNLCLSVKTVDTHVANLMKKTGLNKRTQLLAHAFEQGLV
ncbi:response regulator [Vampirovibrio sp.]|uniref:response regulator n=1 Tax=Vampirovibrio sp. TaxID=2717857 RepID=UPI0035948E5F